MTPISTESKQRGARAKERKGAFTIMIVPDNGEKMWSLKLSPDQLRYGFIGLSGFACLLLIAALVFVFTVGNTEELMRLRIVNEEQKQQIEAIQYLTTSVQERVHRVHEMDNTIRRMVGLEEDKNPVVPLGNIGESAIAEEIPGAETEPAAGYVPSRSTGFTRSVSAIIPSTSNEEMDFESVKHTLQELNHQLENQQEGLGKLAKEVELRLDYLSAVPSSAPVRGEISSSFGYRQSPFGTKKEFHSGLDIAADYGTPVRSAAKGKIIFVGWKPGLGKTVEVEHGYGFTTAYCHLSATSVRVGDVVERADMIGKVGNSGRSTGPHLHFMIYKKGNLQDPQRYMLH
ncbi:M23 family metallopeptidase [Heliophilum fasciatum]|uniref:Murein DD-endopeptidase MepM/ murein hydrolase activator NlpD n=1 Tax=Heliophilum fasciatum TaxID=35700 RepID=A0A4R2RJ99_9FIRM|nr:M23 family metallopeptidase [Heliophilum fasciatum]MCW2278266.1 murein DD-endopeptidase MepM/ murein hydrolase activator NlpD [Heliophilum fasciatum]TCP63890.1 murein DD-endopeptidase MepM/ murein hydrolase activator NlpD [Heliophilum fasciatum]